MVVKKAWIPSRGTYSVGESSEPFNPTVGALSHSKSSPANIDDDSDYDLAPDEDDQRSAEELLDKNDPLKQFLKVASLANLAMVYKSTEGEGWTARGDPTEIAIQVFASRFDWNRKKLVEGDHPPWKLVMEYPFSSDVKKMSVIFKEEETSKRYAFTKGAVERVIDSCVQIDMKGSDEPEPLTDDIKEDILAAMEAIAAQGLRCLALASKEYDGPAASDAREQVESELIFRGLVGLYDPPRPESKGAVKKCHRAGVGVHMLTGDRKFFEMVSLAISLTSHRPWYCPSNRSPNWHRPRQAQRSRPGGQRCHGHHCCEIRQALR
jgi:P-type Na+/K+ transporter